MAGLPPIAPSRYEWADLPLGVSITGAVHPGREIGKSDTTRAVKVLKAGAWQRDLLHQTLARMADAPAHAGISRVLDMQLDREPSFLVGEWWGTAEAGRHRPRSLAAMRKSLRRREIPRLLLELADALAHLHRHGIFHGAVKPTNILLTPDHHVKLTDVGVLPTGAVRSVPLATEPFFSPPEQWRNPTAWDDGRGQLWDVYSFGAVAFMLLADRLPRLHNLAATLVRGGSAMDDSSRPAATDRRIFTPERVAELLEQVTTIAWPARTSVDPAWRSAITACLQIDPDARPRDMSEVCRMIASGHREQRRTTVRGFSTALMTLSAAAAVAALGGWGTWMWYNSLQEMAQLQKEVAAPLAESAPAQEQQARQDKIKKYLASRSTDLPAIQALARTQLILDQEADLAETLKLWTALEPNRSVAWYDITGDAARKRRDMRPALEAYERGYAIAGNTPRGQELLEEIERLHIAGGEYRSAAEAVTRMLAAEDTTALRIRRARLYLLANSWREGYADLETVRKRDPNAALLRPMAPYLTTFGTLIKALEEADRAVLQHPNEAAPHAQRAALLMLCGQMPAARASAGRALEIIPASLGARPAYAAPEAALPQVVIGLTHMAMQQHPELVSFSHPLSTNGSLGMAGPAPVAAPAGSPPPEILAVEQLPSSEALTELGVLDEAVRTRPGAESLAKRAAALNRIGQYNLALADAKAAVASDKRHIAAQLQLVIALDQLDRAKEALSTIVALSERSPKDAQIWEWRARTEKLLGRITLGLESVRKALDLAPGDEPPAALVQLQQELKAMAPSTSAPAGDAPQTRSSAPIRADRQRAADRGPERNSTGAGDRQDRTERPTERIRTRPAPAPSAPTSTAARRESAPRSVPQP